METGTRLTPVEMLDRLVAFDTESSRSNLPLVEFVTAYLEGWGVPSVRSYDASRSKASLWATIGPARNGGIVLSGHTDVVPVTGQAWSGDPFRLRVVDGRAYGRGAVDMKGFCALALALVPDFLAAGLSTPIHILLSYDEETTCLGPVDLIARFGRDLPRPEAAIVGEPTGLAVADAHKSVVTFTTTVHGREGHSSKPNLGANAVVAAAQLVAELDRIADDMIARGDPSGRFDPPCTTVHVGTIEGGTARNIIPKLCAFHWEFRGVPGLDEAEIPTRLDRFAREVVLPRLDRHGPGGRIETACDIAVPGLAPEPGSAAERLALGLTGQAAPISMPFATEAGRFQAAGVPTVVCGPGCVDQAHRPDEFIAIDDLAAGELFLRRLAATLGSA